jgi:DNA invertase Pin-like site-specific DNA recombinase
MNANESLSPSKIKPFHRDRWAIVYVRQSSAQQIQHHKESAQVQANLKLRALEWGWPAERIRVIDGDQGRSGTTTVGRDEFTSLIGEIALGHVGLVLGFQINRLAREDEACCRLIKTCANSDTLLADLDGVYHPLDFNDRMILTIKGFMGGFELHQIQQRMQAGRLNRVRRGEWLGQPPNGYIVGPDHKLQIDPDQEVQQRLRLIFEQFDKLGSVTGVLRYLRENRLDLPLRNRFGDKAGVLQWRTPTREKLRVILRHPAYAGAFTWGRRGQVRAKVIEGRRGTGRVECEPDKCSVFLRDNHDAYITWEQYQTNRERLRTQRQRGPIPGPARLTKATLAGLVVCGCCGARVQTRYTRSLRYQCQHQAFDTDAKACPSFAGESLEQLVREQVLQLMTPAGLELCLHAQENCDRERATLEKSWKLRLERAQQEIDRTFRQYDAVEPENRMVARTLEKAWEEKLQTQRQLSEEYDRFLQTQPLRLSAAERTQIEALAKDLPTLWDSPESSIVEKRQVLRLLLDRVVVWPSATDPKLRVQLHWKGGVITEHETVRTMQSWEQLPNFKTLLAQVQQMRAEGQNSEAIAAALNAQGQLTMRGRAFTANNVRQLLSRKPQRRARKKGGKSQRKTK